MSRYPLKLECEIVCDRCERHETYVDHVTERLDQVGRREGPYPMTWWSDGMTDLCPECAEIRGLATLADLEP